MEPISVEAFERLVGDALDQLPDDLAQHIDNVVVMVEDAHPDEDLLGLYEGLPLTERDEYGNLDLPDRITLYRLALCDHVENMEQLRQEVVVTIVHEVAHHFGIDDDRLHELGWA